MMDIAEAIQTRRSIRAFNGRPVDIETVKELIRAAQCAPSACNRQGWRYIYINDREKLANIRRHGGASFLEDTPCAILVAYNNRTDNTEYRDHIQSAAASIQNLILQAHSLGIGSCWVCHLPSKRELRRMFGIPSCYDPVALVALGSHDRTPQAAPRQPVESVLCVNAFSFDEPREPLIPAVLYIRRLARRLYYLCPMKKFLEPFVKKYEKRFDDR